MVHIPGDNPWDDMDADVKPIRVVIWTHEEAVDLCRELRAIAEPVGFSVGLTGGCLYRGYSSKDVDIIFYPLKCPSEFDVSGLRDVLKEHEKLKCVFDREKMRSNWRYKNISDTKWVEVWDYDGKRVDFFFMT